MRRAACPAVCPTAQAQSAFPEASGARCPFCARRQHVDYLTHMLQAWAMRGAVDPEQALEFLVAHPPGI